MVGNRDRVGEQLFVYLGYPFSILSEFNAAGVLYSVYVEVLG